MAPIHQRLSKNQLRISSKKFICKVCKGRHALKDCKDFHRLAVDERIRAVMIHGYCTNCLAHLHSAGSCFTKSGCKRCGGNHHTLLHIPDDHKPGKVNVKHPKLKKSSSISSLNKSVTLSSITSQHHFHLFPTAVLLVQHGMKQHHVRAVIDTCSSFSKISSKLVNELDLSIARLGDESICSVTLQSRQPSQPTIQATMKVNNKISMNTPTKSIDSIIATRFSNLNLADPQFFKSRSIAMVLGADLYSKLILNGLIPSNNGLPVAMNTIFGWVLAGSCAI
ncbi:uncharacterized protein LOC131998181 [Stomoxys calcitrans]|uniref:uncharacterized protein LOC131995351 n=1 Tax=Stomoxys calcitrans TaxID=35570 RepID=UPI0027E260F9|nr:uncharacterized protein LOC131995351 [Stomoxys calcitrans]XP_059221748.1 uncharacterized protein LOC131996252 [Stomoxys calcitrans]XP_059221792.1 uncharacterized protein LOC131996274 [Stomoxys calcitrans]XP_059226537.1 uncharacterized protein LOC131998181 [Stomoxys calcitrans]